MSTCVPFVPSVLFRAPAYHPRQAPPDPTQRARPFVHAIDNNRHVTSIRVSQQPDIVVDHASPRHAAPRLNEAIGFSQSFSLLGRVGVPTPGDSFLFLLEPVRFTPHPVPSLS